MNPLIEISATIFALLLMLAIGLTAVKVIFAFLERKDRDEAVRQFDKAIAANRQRMESEKRMEKTFEKWKEWMK